MDSEKCWPRRRRPTIECLVAASLLLAAGWVSAQAPIDESEPEAIVSLERFLAEVDSFSADFRQDLLDADQRLIETSFGSLSLRRPDRFRWNYRTPYEQLVLADGEHLWMYDVELAQVTVTRLAELGSTSPAMLLSGDEAVQDGFEVAENFAADGRQWVRLIPKAMDTEFQQISMGFEAGSLRALELVDGLNQTTRIEFSGTKTNPRLSDRLFEFRVPRGVDVIGDQG